MAPKRRFSHRSRPQRGRSLSSKTEPSRLNFSNSRLCNCPEPVLANHRRSEPRNRETACYREQKRRRFRVAHWRGSGRRCPCRVSSRWDRSAALMLWGRTSTHPGCRGGQASQQVRAKVPAIKTQQQQQQAVWQRHSRP
jgi:hypothetical protein